MLQIQSILLTVIDPEKGAGSLWITSYFGVDLSWLVVNIFVGMNTEIMVDVKNCFYLMHIHGMIL